MVISFIDKAVAQIKSTEFNKKKLMSKVIPLKEQNLNSLNESEILESKLVFPVKKTVLNHKIAGVDSGFIGKKLFSFDLFLVRASGVMFSYEENKVVKADYFPSFFSFPEPFLKNSLPSHEDFDFSQSLHRLREEVSLSMKLIQKFKPNFLFIDGSIVPQYMDKPPKMSPVKSFYEEIVELFQNFYSVAEENKTELISCVEDSRGLRFKTILEFVLKHFNGNSPKELDSSYDAILLDYILKEGERSLAFSYTASVKEHPVLNDFKKEWAEKIHAFYLKPSAFDRPLRVEFIKSKEPLSEQVERISSIVYSLSSFHREYAYPSILIEADLRAKLRPEEIEIVLDKISDKLGARFNLLMRRDKRPF